MILLNHFKQHFVLWFVFIVTIIWIVNTFIMDDRVERHELQDDSVIVVLGQEKKYRFKVPVDYLYDLLLAKELSAERFGIFNTTFKKVYSDGDYFYVYATYPDMNPVDRSNDKPGHGNKISISIGIDTGPIPLRKSAFQYVSGRHPNGGMIPEGFDSTEIIQYEEHDREKYFYRDGDIYMQCIKREETLDYFPSCMVYFNYKELELIVNFASKYKTNFLDIHARIHELLKSFEQ